MASVIDPVTGLPMPAAPEILSDIPLGTQVFPWADVKAANLPPQGPSYPNDILNTAALLTALDPTQPDKPAQALYTDGNHNLRLSSGGGGIDYQRTGAGRIQEIAVSPRHETHINTFDTVSIPQYLYQFSFGLAVTNNFSGDDYSKTDLYLMTDASTGRIPLWSGYMAAISPGKILNKAIVFDPPLALNEIYGNDMLDTLYVYCWSDSFNLMANSCLRNSL